MNELKKNRQDPLRKSKLTGVSIAFISGITVTLLSLLLGLKVITENTPVITTAVITGIIFLGAIITLLTFIFKPQWTTAGFLERFRQKPFSNNQVQMFRSTLPLPEQAFTRTPTGASMPTDFLETKLPGSTVFFRQTTIAPPTPSKNRSTLDLPQFSTSPTFAASQLAILQLPTRMPAIQPSLSSTNGTSVNLPHQPSSTINLETSYFSDDLAQSHISQPFTEVSSLSPI
jgi:hypothetical protein